MRQENKIQKTNHQTRIKQKKITPKKKITTNQHQKINIEKSQQLQSQQAAQQQQAKTQITKPLTKEQESQGATPTTSNQEANPRISVRYWIKHMIGL